jgi:hypothetical protein
MNEINRLFSGPIHWFKDWPCGDVPQYGAIVYTIWNRNNDFIYVGMSGRGIKEGDTSIRTSKGPWGRLNSHAGGRRSGDQFCVYVCDRLLLRRIGNRIPEISDGELSMDKLNREFIRADLGFRWLVSPSGNAALDLERKIQRGEYLPGHPILNGVQNND